MNDCHVSTESPYICRDHTNTDKILLLACTRTLHVDLFLQVVTHTVLGLLEHEIIWTNITNKINIRV